MIDDHCSSGALVADFKRQLWPSCVLEHDHETMARTAAAAVMKTARGIDEDAGSGRPDQGDGVLRLAMRQYLFIGQSRPAPAMAQPPADPVADVRGDEGEGAVVGSDIVDVD